MAEPATISGEWRRLLDWVTRIPVRVYLVTGVLVTAAMGLLSYAGVLHLSFRPTLFTVLIILFALTVGSALFERKRQKLTEEMAALRSSEQQFRSLIEGATYGIFRSTDKGFLTVNPALVKMLGYASEEELLQLDVSTDLYLDVQQRQAVVDLYRRRAEIRDQQVRWKRKDGGVIDVQISGGPFLDSKGQFAGYEMIAEDVTERNRLEEQLQQTQRLTAIGRLAGGVAHDFNNMLTVISGFTQLVLDRLNERDPIYAHLIEVRSASHRAAALTHQLLAFSRQQVMAPSVLDLNDIIQSMAGMLRRLVREDVEIILKLQPDLGHTKADESQMQQVIMNLGANARDAMPSGGTLTIETANVILDEQYARSNPDVPPGRYILLAFSDTGQGMDPDLCAHIFEPFFTTKRGGKGTGLGLSTVYGIVTQSGGHIVVESRVGLGTRFKVYLPLVAEAVRVSETHPKVAAAGGFETILLVEDEDAVRSFALHALRQNGYTVLEASNGTEALSLFESYKGPIHLLLTDLVMQQMGGRELAQRLTRSHPGLRLVYMSGYTDDAILQQELATTGTAFLQKPFGIDALARKVREVLDTPVGPEFHATNNR